MRTSLPACCLVHFQIFEMRLIFRLNIKLNSALHPPVQHLIVNRQIELVLLNLCPDFTNDSVTLCKVCFRFKRHNLGIHISIRISGVVP